MLQSVDVSMGPDGATTGVGSSVVRTDGSVEDAETSDETYAPQDVVGDLPVRVLTSWRTSEGAGTDLADLQGYTGRIAIDVTVQNLTVKPEVLTYDAAGASHQQAALVGSPLTVTASTALGDLKPERVVTDDKGTGVNVTNGILGENADGTTVQWAALLAPPVLSSSTEMSLVVDAKDFDVPTIDLSVQPGLVSDPSIGALVDSAFNPASSGELDLQRRTIDLITDVNLVLARASDTISDVRTSLTSSAETLGTQTVSDLQSSTQTVASNMSSLDGALQSLRGDLSSTLESTGSSAIAEMDEAVSTVDRLLGDTSAERPSIRVDDQGCETVVPDPKQSGTVYGNLLQVAGQLDAYAAATGLCKEALQASIKDTIGTTSPDEASCTTSDGGAVKSVTCSLHRIEQDFLDVAETFGMEMTDALKLLKPELYDEAVTAANDLVDIANGDPDADPPVLGIPDFAEAINDRRIDMYKAIIRARDALSDDGSVGGKLDTIETGLNDLRSRAEIVRGELVDMQGQSVTAADNVCRLLDQFELTKEQSDEARVALGYLVESSDCTNGNLPAPEAGPLATRLGDQAAVLEESLTSSQDAVTALADARSAAQELAGQLDTIAEYSGDEGPDLDPEGNPTMRKLFRELNLKLEELNAQAGVLNEKINGIKDLAVKVEEIGDGIDAAVSNAQKAARDGVAKGTTDVLEAGADADAELETMFTRSVEGLRASADSVVTDGRRSINEQEQGFFAAQERAANQISDTVGDGLAQIDSGVSSSTRDMEAATTLLTADLRKVLLDLGDRKVGGGGLLGAMATNAATARTADFQLALAGDKAASYANVRSRDIDGLMLRQAQTDAAMQKLIDMPAFQLDLPSGSQHRTVYSFRIGDS